MIDDTFSRLKRLNNIIIPFQKYPNKYVYIGVPSLNYHEYNKIMTKI